MTDITPICYPPGTILTAEQVVPKLLALSEARRVLRPRGRFVASVPSPIPPLFTILAEQLERHGQHGAAEFVRPGVLARRPAD